MNAPILGPRALGGGFLQGDNWVRFLYLDEAGTGNVKHDPVMVVAGVLIHADQHWMELAQRLAGLLHSFTPEGSPVPSCLHAKDIFHGSGEFPRESWDMPRRMKLLESVAMLLHAFNVPIVWAAIDRNLYDKEHLDCSKEENKRDLYTVLTVTCLMKAETFMRASTPLREVTSVVLEENHDLQRRIPEVMDFIRNPGEKKKDLNPGWEKVIPFQRIVDTPSIQSKTRASILQIADYCAFSLSRRLKNGSQGEHLIGPLTSQLLTLESPSTAASLDPEKVVFWNPTFMPHLWGGKIEFRGGRFVMKA